MSVKPDAEFCHHCGAKVGEHKHVPWWHLHRRVYDWTLHFAEHKHSTTALFCLSFAESSFFPIPPDVLLMPLVLGDRKKWFHYAFTCSLASVIGAVFGFLIGWLAWAQVGGFFHDNVPGFSRDVVTLKTDETRTGLLDQECVELESMFESVPKYPLTFDGGAGRIEEDAVEDVEIHAFTRIGAMYEKYNFWIVFTAGFTPLPFKVITITAGIFGTGETVANPLGFFAMFLLASAISRSARFFLVSGLMYRYGPKITPFIEKYFNLLALLFAVLLVGGFVVVKYVF